MVWVNVAVGGAVEGSWPLQKARKRFCILVRSFRIHAGRLHQRRSGSAPGPWMSAPS